MLVTNLSVNDTFATNEPTCVTCFGSRLTRSTSDKTLVGIILGESELIHRRSTKKRRKPRWKDSSHYCCGGFTKGFCCMLGELAPELP